MSQPVRSADELPAVGAQVQRRVGRPVPERTALTPLKQRIVDALAGRGEVSYWALAYELWPPALNVRAWRHATNGGPHGWAMPLGKALRELENAGIVRERLRTQDHPERTVYLKTPNARLTGPKRPTQDYANGTE